MYSKYLIEDINKSVILDENIVSGVLVCLSTVCVNFIIIKLSVNKYKIISC
jgi:hypothetical protein